MKCPNCGADVSVSDERCRYCGTPNKEGAMFRKAVRARKLRNDRMEEQVRRDVAEKLPQRFLTIIIVILTIPLVLVILSAVLYFFLKDSALFGGGVPKDADQVMAEMYENGEFRQLRFYMIDHELSSREYEQYEKYEQICEIFYGYDRFVQNAMNCTAALDRHTMPGDYEIENVVRYAHEVLDPSVLAVTDSYPENDAVISAWQDEVLAYMKGRMGLREEMFATFYPTYKYDYFSSEDREAMIMQIQMNLLDELN